MSPELLPFEDEQPTPQEDKAGRQPECPGLWSPTFALATAHSHMCSFPGSPLHPESLELSLSSVSLTVHAFQSGKGSLGECEVAPGEGAVSFRNIELST